MPRPHIEFVQSQYLPFVGGALGGARSALAAKVLSRDSESGATSSVLRVPPGWRGEGAIATDEEFLVLEGAQAGLETGFNRQRYSSNGFFPPPIGGNWFNDANVQLRASYDFDWWGKHQIGRAHV